MPTTTSDKKDTISQLYLLFERFRQSGDERRARQSFHLLKKWQNQTFTICFCGHFSAGKSSLINALMDDDVLPTSPIPTSANLVSVQNGGPKIEVVFHSGDTESFHPPYDMAAIKNRCRDNGVAEVRVKVGTELPENWVWMDTPGIDSTDPAHQMATEDAVLQADAVFYVADYNHVQSTPNFRFMTHLKTLNKPVHLVVSQIDKHDEAEIAFDRYRQNVLEALNAWDLMPKSIHFISTVDGSHPANEWKAFKQCLLNLQTSVGASADKDKVLHHLVSAHKSWWMSEYEAKKAAFEEQIATNKTIIPEAAEEIEQAVNKWTAARDGWQESILSEVNRAIDSAILMPYETRDLARQYLEARQSDFKVGLFASKRKRDAERERRLDAFCESLTQTVNTMNLQVSATLLRSIQDFIEADEKIKAKTADIQLTVTSEFIAGLVQEGALATGDYVLNYTENVAGALKKNMKRQARGVLNQLAESVEKSIQTKLVEAEQVFTRVETNLAAVKALDAIVQDEQAHFTAIEQIITGEWTDRDDKLSQIKDAINTQEVWISKTDPTAVTHVKTLEKEVSEQSPPSGRQPARSRHSDEWAAIFEEAAGLLEPIEGFKTTAERLKNKANRLRAKRFMVALFGAFSAGKSSFANALLGDDVLPVSPHPTTATINRILPVDQDHPHRTAIVQLKSEQELLTEVNQSLDKYGKPIKHFEDMETILSWIPENDGHDRVVFLHAIAKGYQTLASSLGTALQLDLPAAQTFISNESKAVFVRDVAIYYDCEATRDGIVLVDTPGADSINARHTEAAFQFIKNADAIVFVTYYNHAFSKADEEFLIQLGRVKEAFELDKMFFMVNAIDLARKSSEIDLVIDYVRGRLLTFGIRQARIFGVSSRLGLQAKKAKNGHLDEALYDRSGFPAFNLEWSEYIQTGIFAQSIRQGSEDIQRTAAFIRELLEKAHLDQKERERYLVALTDGYHKACQLIDQDRVGFYENRLKQEIRELYFYVKKRVIQRYLEEFARFFNPAVLNHREEGSKKDILRRCLDDCLAFVSYDLDQETRATFLRTEALLNQALKSEQEDIDAALKQTEPGWSVNSDIEPQWEAPKIKRSLAEYGTGPFETVFRHYKNPKQFFEGDGRMLFRSSLETLLSDVIDDIIAENEALTNNHYVTQIHNYLVNIRLERRQEIDTVYHRRTQSLNPDNDAQMELETIYQQLSRII